MWPAAAIFILLPAALCAQTSSEPEGREPQTIKETVTVVAPAAPTPPESATLRHAVDGTTLVALPLNGRQVMALAALAPGVALPPGSMLPRINGGRPRTNEYVFDGISVLQPEPGQVPFFPIPDAILTFTIQSSVPAAEYGRFNGGVISLTTRSGTDEVHGSLFGFFRHESLNARPYFASPTRAKPLFRRSQFGWVAGGPLRRRSVFFFADYQRQRQNIGRSLISTVPTALQREGIFTQAVGEPAPDIYDPSSRLKFPNNTVPRERFDPVAASLLERYPAPTSDGTANNYQRDGNETDDQDQFDLRVDHRAADGTRMAFLRMSGFAGHVQPVTALPDGSGTSIGALGPQDTRAGALAANYATIVSPSHVNELRVGVTSREVRRRATRAGGSILPTYVIAGYQHLGSPPNTETDFRTSVLQMVDTFSWSAARHVIKAGLDFRWSQLDVLQPPSPAGVYQFSALFTHAPGVAASGAPLASFLLGQVQSFSIDLQSREIRNRAHAQEYFVQDDWTVSDRLALSLGLRYTLNFPSVEDHNQAAVFNLVTQQLEYLGRDGHPRSARRLHTNNLGPRFGIVGRVKDRTVLRAAYGVVWIEQAGITTPFTTPSFPFLQTATQRTLDNRTPAFALAEGPGHIAPAPATATAGLGQGVFSVDRELGSGYVQQWNLSARGELGHGMAIEVGYTGSKVTRVGISDTNLNQLTVEQLALGAPLLERVPNPFFGTVPASSTLGEPTITRAQLMKPYPQYTTVSLYRNNVGNTNYHAVIAKLEQRVSRGVSYSVAYTRSRLMDDASSVFDATVLTGPVANVPVADSFNRRLERDYSTGDMPHVLVAHGMWNIPRSGGLTLSGIATLQSGAPLAVTQITNFNAFAGFGTQRPNISGDPSLQRGERSTSRWFNTGAFSSSPQFTLGSSTRNPVRGPGYANVDVALARNVRVARRLSLETRAEVFNVLNTPALGSPNTIVGSPGFGSITSAGDPRVMQLVVKLLF